MAVQRYEFLFSSQCGKILFLTPENKVHIFKPPYNFFLLYRQIYRSPFSLTVCTNNGEKVGNYTINILTGEDMENMALRPRM